MNKVDENISNNSNVKTTTASIATSSPNLNKPELVVDAKPEIKEAKSNITLITPGKETVEPIPTKDPAFPPIQAAKNDALGNQQGKNA